MSIHSLLQNSWLGDFFHLIYPDTCAACGQQLQIKEDTICLFCELELPYTDYHLQPENPLAKQFWGRLQLVQVAAMCQFIKGGRVQKLIHHLKYDGWTDVGVRMGQLYGQTLKQTPAFQSIEAIIPVPLHPDKLRKRGYNQSDCFAEGLAQSMEIPWYADALQRTTFTKTQTKKSNFDRWKNVENVFIAHRPELLEKKHVLLVDDVITTGSTIEACGNALLAVEGCKVSVASIATAVGH